MTSASIVPRASNTANGVRDQAGQVRIGGARAKASYSAPVVAPIKIGIGNIAEITVTRAAHPRRDKRQELDQERSSLLKSVASPPSQKLMRSSRNAASWKPTVRPSLRSSRPSRK